MNVRIQEATCLSVRIVIAATSLLYSLPVVYKNNQYACDNIICRWPAPCLCVTHFVTRQLELGIDDYNSVMVSQILKEIPI